MQCSDSPVTTGPTALKMVQMRGGEEFPTETWAAHVAGRGRRANEADGPFSASSGVQRRDIGSAKHENDGGVVHEHDEGDEDAEGAVNLIVDAHVADVEP